MEVEEIIASEVSFILLAGIVTVGRFSKKPRRWQLLGIICMACASPALLSGTNWFLFVVVTSFIATLIWTFIYLLSIREVLKLPVNWSLTELFNTGISTGLYLTAFIVQLSAWSPYHWSSLRSSNLTAGSFGLFNTLVYAAATYFLYLDWKSTGGAATQ